MHRVDCESCKATYQVDERRIPLSGLKMRCPKCGHTFLVKIEGGVAIVKPIQAGGVGGAAPPPSSKPDSASKTPAALADDPFA
ncbi:MAG: zinc-ribbon domain-containing protein, partial [Vulcanimicrobiaceae bacterium]